MKKIYNTPKTSVICVQHATDMMTTSRFFDTNGEDYENVLEDRDGDEEPIPKSKYHGWDLWEDD